MNLKSGDAESVATRTTKAIKMGKRLAGDLDWDGYDVECLVGDEKRKRRRQAGSGE